MAEHRAPLRTAISALPLRQVRIVAGRADPPGSPRSRVCGAAVNDAIDRDRELFARIAEVNPGVVRTLSLLLSELDGGGLDPTTMRELGDRIRRIGETSIMRAGRGTAGYGGRDACRPPGSATRPG